MFVATTSKNQVNRHASSVFTGSAQRHVFPANPGTAQRSGTAAATQRHRRHPCLQVLVSDPATPYDVITEVCLRLLLPVSGSPFILTLCQVDDRGFC
jgi:hypothetical protein